MSWFYTFTPYLLKLKFIPPLSVSWMVSSLWVFQLKFSAYFLHPYLSYISKSFHHNCCNHPNDTLFLLWIFYTILFLFVSFLEYWFNSYIPCWRYCFTLALDDTQKKQCNLAYYEETCVLWRKTCMPFPSWQASQWHTSWLCGVLSGSLASLVALNTLIFYRDFSVK